MSRSARYARPPTTPESLITSAADLSLRAWREIFGTD